MPALTLKRKDVQTKIVGQFDYRERWTGRDHGCTYIQPALNL